MIILLYYNNFEINELSFHWWMQWHNMCLLVLACNEPCYITWIIFLSNGNEVQFLQITVFLK